MTFEKERQKRLGRARRDARGGSTAMRTNGALHLL